MTKTGRVITLASRSDSLDLVHQLRRFMEEAGTEPRPGCSKRMRPQARCLLCPPLFPLSKRGKDWHAVMSDEHPSPNAFSGMVLRALRNVGCDTRAFSGDCARRGYRGWSAGARTVAAEWPCSVPLSLSLVHSFKQSRVTFRYMALLQSLDMHGECVCS